MDSSISIHFISISHYKKLRMIASHALIFSVMKNRSIPRKSNILTTHQPKGLEGSDSQAKMWRHSTPSSASALKGPTPPPQSVATINLSWFSPGGAHGCPWVRDPVKLRGEETREDLLQIFVSFKSWRENKIEWSMGVLFFPICWGVDSLLSEGALRPEM